MNLVCKARQMELTAQLQSHINKRFQKLSPYFGGEQLIEIEILHEENPSLSEAYQVTATAWFGGSFEKAQKRAADPLSAIDQVANLLLRQIRKDNKKRWERHHAGGQKNHQHPS